MRIGIVGAEAAKFTALGQERAREEIRGLIQRLNARLVVSGACHLGGVDLWAIEEAQRLNVGTMEFPPKDLQWSTGYMPRNKLIAQNSDRVFSLVVDRLPPGYTGMRFPLCYHCGTNDHVKSGGCWTTKFARSLGKVGTTIVLRNEGEI